MNIAQIITSTISNTYDTSLEYIQTKMCDALIAEKTAKDYLALAAVIRNYHEEVVLIVSGNLEMRRKLFETGNKVLESAILKKDVELAQIALEHISLCNSINPFLSNQKI